MDLRLHHINGPGSFSAAASRFIGVNTAMPPATGAPKDLQQALA
jgi:hypothetical protein